MIYFGHDECDTQSSINLPERGVWCSVTAWCHLHVMKSDAADLSV